MLFLKDTLFAPKAPEHVMQALRLYCLTLLCPRPTDPSQFSEIRDPAGESCDFPTSSTVMSRERGLRHSLQLKQLEGKQHSRRATAALSRVCAHKSKLLHVRLLICERFRVGKIKGITQTDMYQINEMYLL